jgi:hypothetical protein
MYYTLIYKGFSENPMTKFTTGLTIALDVLYCYKKGVIMKNDLILIGYGLLGCLCILGIYGLGTFVN